ncbi:endonuclease [Altererythrobacter soli]|uniref:Endonuclease n=2 Tax=Croceibacterium soli TaxID=1739690 RepID=A0A6I4UXE0_9SPHN|nr:endonuclease [Croceibacterium soli]
MSGGGGVPPDPASFPAPPADRGDFSVLTYNVKGLPWPVALGRGAALQRIGDRLAHMRAAGQQPSVVVLQEAFIGEAKAIGERAGYRYRVFGPRDSVASAHPGIERRWYLGETQGKQLDSGLLILSDFPITDMASAAFPTDACAGFDCLAAKGVVLVTIEVPGKGPVAVATTHFNSRGASLAPGPATAHAFAAQSQFLAAFLKREWRAGTPLVLAGDFNVGRRPFRMATLPKALATVSGERAPAEGLRATMTADKAGIGRSPDALSIRDSARDMQFIFDGEDRSLKPVGAAIPFGTEAGGSALSDHMGFMIHYRVVPQGSSATRGKRDAA